MTASIEHSRNEILVDVRAKRASALRLAVTGGPGDKEYWLRIAGRMTAWIERLEKPAGVRPIPPTPNGQAGTHVAIDLPPNARPSRAPAAPVKETASGD